MTDPNWTLEWLKITQGLFGTLVGGGLVLLGGWLTDRRRDRKEEDLRGQREKALFTGMFAVRNFILGRINEWSDGKDTARLEPLRTAQAYVHRLIDKAPGESQSLMISIVEIGLSIDALLATLDRPFDDAVALKPVIERQVLSMLTAIDQFDIFSRAELAYLSEEDMMRFPGYAEAMAEGDADDAADEETKL